MTTLFILLDLAAILSSLVAAIFWYRAGTRTMRRVSQFETLGHLDINRLVVAMNRNAILNRRVALASAAAAICFALRFGASLAAPVSM